MDRQLKRVGLVLAALFGVVMAWGIVRAARDRDWPTTGDTVGCWTSGPWRVQLIESSLISGSMRFRTSGIQRSAHIVELVALVGFRAHQRMRAGVYVETKPG